LLTDIANVNNLLARNETALAWYAICTN
jgi:hypothetical protein